MTSRYRRIDARIAPGLRLIDLHDVEDLAGPLDRRLVLLARDARRLADVDEPQVGHGSNSRVRGCRGGARTTRSAVESVRRGMHVFLHGPLRIGREEERLGPVPDPATGVVASRT